MSVSVAEYLGQRTDITLPNIVPVPAGMHPLCPFMNNTCSKLSMTNPKKPVCSVRKTDGTLWIVCRHRLCATKKTIPLSNYQVDTLHKVAKTIYNPSISLSNVLVKREVSMPVVANSRYSADFVMMSRNNTSTSRGHRRVILEMQGGGETSSTGGISTLVDNWENEASPTNSSLAQVVRGPAPIETNAWRRQQEQFIVKGNIAIQTGGGIAFCVGSLIFDYLWSKVEGANLRDLRGHNWTLALIGICEDKSMPARPGPIPLMIDESRLLFTNYPTFIATLTNQGGPHEELFQGMFDVLDGSTSMV